VLLSVLLALPASLEPPQPARATLSVISASAWASSPQFFPHFMFARPAIQVKNLESAPARYFPKSSESSVDGDWAMRGHRDLLRQPRYLVSQSDLKTGGFASPPHDGFALTLPSQLIPKRTAAQSVSTCARRQIATRRRALIYGAPRLVSPEHCNARDRVAE
jgi:hypothetical protein